MAMPKPGIETLRSNQAQETSAISAIVTTTAVHRRPGWSNPREHVKSLQNYFEEHTSDEEPTEDDDETDLDDDDVCHMGCEVCYNRLSCSLL